MFVCTGLNEKEGEADKHKKAGGKSHENMDLLFIALKKLICLY
jgi:hypothetical protein